MKIYTLIIIILLLVANTGICYSLTYQKLIEEGKNYDNQPIELTGEIIGDIIYKENTYWINILSRPEGIAIGILISKEMAKEIKVLGDYFHIGDIINVKGKFYRFYKDEGGETMIFAKDIKILKRGYHLHHPLDNQKIILGFLGLFIGFTFNYFVYRYRS